MTLAFGVKYNKYLKFLYTVSALNFQKYESYYSEDFVADEYFSNWVKSPSDSTITCFWLSFLKKHPEKSDEIMLARRQILKLNVAKSPLSDSEILNLWHRINLTINTN